MGVRPGYWTVTCTLAMKAEGTGLRNIAAKKGVGAGTVRARLQVSGKQATLT
jgi:hypothetical protein